MKRVLQYFIWFGLLYLLVEIFSFATLVSTYVSKPVDIRLKSLNLNLLEQMDISKVRLLIIQVNNLLISI